MSTGSLAFTANGFTSGSVNRPWHRSGPPAAASPWIMHGGKFKNDFRLQGGFAGTLLLRKVRGWFFEDFVQELSNVIRPFAGATHLWSGLCDVTLLCILNTFFWALLARSLCKRMQDSCGEWQSSGDWTSRAFLILSEYFWLNSFNITPQYWPLSLHHSRLNLLSSLWSYRDHEQLYMVFVVLCSWYPTGHVLTVAGSSRSYEICTCIDLNHRFAFQIATS